MSVAQIKSRLLDYVEDVTDHSSKGNRKGYICPLCKSGLGRNKTGALSVTKDGLRWKCFSCDQSGDVFDLIGLIEGINDYSGQLRRASELFKIPIENHYLSKKNPSQSELSMKGNLMTEQENNNYTNFFKEAHANIYKTDYAKKRGLSDEIINRFMLGYIENWKHPNASDGISGSPRLIIPVSKNSYFARDTRDDIPNFQQSYSKIKVGGSNLFNASVLNQNLDKPIFVVEGEIDALSVMEVGGEAIGLGGVGNISKLLKRLENAMLKQPLIISLDNDSAGQEKQRKLVNSLKEKNIPFKIGKITCKETKDPNEMLVKNRQLFSKLVNETSANLDDKKKQYLNNSSRYHLQNFINGINDSVNASFIPTNFKKLDDLLDGGLYEGLYVVGAISSLGKTTLVTQIADQIAEQGFDVLIISLEMSRNEIMAKSISRNTMKEVVKNDSDIRNAKTVRGIMAGSKYSSYSTVEHELINTAVKEYSDYANHIYIIEGMGNVGVREVRKFIERHQHFTGKSPVLVIDYLQILAPFNERATDKQNTDKAVLELKRISRDFKIPVIGISSFNRDNYNNSVGMQSFKESGAIEYSSDVLIGLQFKGVGEIGFDINEAKSRNPREVELVVLKNRNGKTGTKMIFDFYAMFNYFEERS